MRIRRRGPRQQTTIARAERDGALVCSDVLVVVHSAAGRLGTKPHDDFTAWFYGALEPDLAHALLARDAQPPDVGPSDEDRPRPEGQRLDDVGAGADAAVE